MYLLKKNNFEFKNILISGYSIDEQGVVTLVKQLANGKRKKIMAGYTDTIIKLNLGGLNEDETALYIANLVDGEYQYWSIKDKQYKRANFIVTMPPQVMESAIGSKSFDDFEVTLEKSSDIEGVSL